MRSRGARPFGVRLGYSKHSSTHTRPRSSMEKATGLMTCGSPANSLTSNSGGTVMPATVSAGVRYGWPDAFRLSNPNSFCARGRPGREEQEREQATHGNGSARGGAADDTAPGADASARPAADQHERLPPRPARGRRAPTTARGFIRLRRAARPQAVNTAPKWTAFRPGSGRPTPVDLEPLGRQRGREPGVTEEPDLRPVGVLRPVPAGLVLDRHLSHPRPRCAAGVHDAASRHPAAGVLQPVAGQPVVGDVIIDAPYTASGERQRVPMSGRRSRPAARPARPQSAVAAALFLLPAHGQGGPELQRPGGRQPGQHPAVERWARRRPRTGGW